MIDLKPVLDWLAARHLCPVVSWIGKNLIPLIALIYGALWLHRFRKQELLKARLQLVTEIAGAFFDLNLAVQDWADPRVKSDEDKFTRFERRRAEVRVAVLKAYGQATLLMSAATVGLLNEIFRLVGLVVAKHENYLMFRENEKAAPGAFTKDRQAAFERSRKELPAEVQARYQELILELRAFLTDRRSAKAFFAKHKAQLETATKKEAEPTSE